MGAEYNGNIIQALTGSDGMLTKLNGDFEKTVDWMIERNGFETSTFQESQKVNKFAGKVGLEDKQFKNRH
ncbi:hypothetical protein BDV40DRAFT_252566 [Aspergillus tamarii]|uniref:Uncharacterized protein n=1 Tax=Aspergillus tamarii TaxID=41984 RepID=A0A5N6V9Y4_ASPTM|nr:hypothetical protein BDV40DRAFT_252566 [Aspergillus tamarii]